MDQNTNLKGKNFLKVCGILMIIGGGLGIIVSIVAILGIAVLAAAGVSSGLLYLSGILLVISSVAELVAGIIGVKNCNNADKAGTCMAWGIVVAVLSVLGNVLTVVGGGDFSVMSFITGLVIPVLFIIGANLNKKEAA